LKRCCSKNYAAPELLSNFGFPPEQLITAVKSHLTGKARELRFSKCKVFYFLEVFQNNIRGIVKEIVTIGFYG
jgi:hypothetical protein